MRLPRHPRSILVLAAAPALALGLAGCGPVTTAAPSDSAAASASAAPSPTPEASSSAAASESQHALPDEAVVTLRVADDEEYRILLTDPADIEIARRLLAGEPAPTIPNGVVVHGSDGGVNAPWSWHIDPATLEWAEVTIEVCDGRPSDVEADTISGERFCPWSAEVIDLEER